MSGFANYSSTQLEVQLDGVDIPYDRPVLVIKREPRRKAKSSTKKMPNMEAIAKAAANGYEAHTSLKHGDPSSSYAGERRWTKAVAIYDRGQVDRHRWRRRVR